MLSKTSNEWTFVTVAAITAVTTLASAPAWAAGPDAAAPAAPAPSAPKSTAAEAEDAARDYKLGLYESAFPYYAAAFDTGGKAADGLRALDCAQKTADYDQIFKIATALGENPKLTKKDRATVDAALADVGAKTGSLTVTAPAGSVVEVGERNVGSAPLGRPLRVPAGDIVVRVTAPDMRPFEKIVKIAAGANATVSADLAPLRNGGYLYVSETKGQAVHVFVDDKDVGAAPWHGFVAPGSHQIVLKGTKLASSSTLVETENDRQQTVTLAATATVGTLKLHLIPANATLMVDNSAATATAGEVELPVGSHHVAAAASGYQTETRDVEIGPGVKTELTMQLAKLTPEGPVTDYSGFYGAFALNYLQPLKSPTLCSSAPSDVTGCSGSSYGGGFALRLGYSFGYVGVEGVVAPMGSYSRQSFHHAANGSGTGSLAGTDYDDTADVYGVGGFAGVGPRFTTHGDIARITLGAQFGVDYHNYIARQVEASNSNVSSGNSEVSPALMLDLGILLGGTPGAKFYIGPTAYFDFQKALALQTPGAFGTPLGFDKSTAVYFGGTLGVFFGH